MGRKGNDRVGIIQYKGALDGKNGVFYGIELSKGKGKHSGLFKGKRYFMCQKGTGIFVDKKQIQYKLEPSAAKPKKKKKKDKKEDVKLTKKGLPRKAGPSSKSSKKKGGWKP